MGPLAAICLQAMRAPSLATTVPLWVMAMLHLLMVVLHLEMAVLYLVMAVLRLVMAVIHLATIYLLAESKYISNLTLI